MDFDLDFKKVDLYELFEILPEATESEIKKAYRKKALLYHPDKNPDNPKANEIFQKLSKALEVLTDKEAKTSYDKILKAKKEREIKNKKLDAKRRKLRDELEAKERVAQEISIQNEEEKLRHEIERIRKEGSKQLEEANMMVQKKLEEQCKNDILNCNQTESNRVKIRRKTKNELTEQLIRKEFSKFGNILFVIVSKNGKSAILEYENYRSLKGLEVNCPKYFEAEILSTKQKTDEPQSNNEKQSVETIFSMENNHEDYEDFVLKQLQEAENKQQTQD